MKNRPYLSCIKHLSIVLVTAACTSLAAANTMLTLPALAGATTVPASTAPALVAGSVGTLRADAGEARSASIGQTIVLDGTRSTNLDGAPLQYSWTLRAPNGSAATLSDNTAVRPAFTVDLLGDYVAELVVVDGERVSEPAAVRITTGNVKPVAEAGAHQRANVGETVLLDAAQSFDFDGDSLSFSWSVEKAPAGSQSQVPNPRASITTFTADRPGDYSLGLVVNDGVEDSARAIVQLSTIDARPMAVAGADWHVSAGATVQLDGRDSVDPDGAPLSYEWSLLHAPVGSNARLSGVTTAQPVLQTDIAGSYVAQLVVSDGLYANAADTVVVEALQPAFPSGPAPAYRGGQDTDGDGVPDALDNCPDQANPTQLDSNGDGFGNRCDPDLDNDGFITNFGDLGLLKLAFFSSPSSPNWNPDADFNGDNVVNFSDLGIMKTFFFGPPGPLVITFSNPAGGDWHDPGNWSPPVVPTTIHTVRIDLDPGVEVEYSTGASEIAGLRATSPVRISGGNLSITKDALFDGGLTIEGGATLANANVLAPTVMPAPVINIPESNAVTFDGITLAADLELERATTLTVINGLTLDNSTITLGGDNNFADLVFSGPNGEVSTLGGVGEVVFSGTATVDDRRRIRVSGSGHGLTVAPGVTIRSDTAGGQVRHDNSNGPVILQGTVISNVASRVIALFGFPLTIEGSLQVSNDGRIQANFGGVGSTIAASATLSVNTGELELFGDFTNEGAITITDGTLDIGQVAGDEWGNSGTITLNNATVELGGSFIADNVGNLSGSGTVTINGALDNTGQTLDLGSLFPGAVQLGTGGSIVGGTVEGTSLTLPESMSFTLDGITLAADLELERATTLTVINGLTLDNSTITLGGDNNFADLVFSGPNGEVSTLGGVGEVVFSGTATVDDRRRIRVSGSGHGLTVAPGVTIRSDTAGGQVRHDNSNGPVILQGTVISNVASRVIALFGFPLTIEGSLQVSNDGRIQANFGGVGSTIAASATLSVNTGELELFGDFTNEGAITITDGTLDIGQVAGDEWGNSGTITLNNATVELGGSFIADNVGNLSGSGTVTINGALDNTGQTLDLGSLFPGAVQLGTGGSIVGGTVEGTSLTLPESMSFTLDGITLAADLELERATTLTVINGLTLDNSTITLGGDNNFADLVFSGPNGEVSTLGGVGEVVFSGTATVDDRRRIRVSGSGHGLTVAPGVTIRSDTAGGQVRHDNSNGPVILQGTVISNVASRVIALFGFPLTIEGSLQVSNDGRIQANFGGVGSTIAASATLSVNTGELELFGDFTNEGAITITDGTLDIGQVAGDEWGNSGTITLNNATVELGGSFIADNVGNLSGSGTVTINGALDNTGQTLDLGSLFPGAVQLGTGGSIVGGTVEGTSLTLPESMSFTLDGITLAADLELERATTLTVINGLTLDNSTITLGGDNNFADLVFSGPNGEVSTLGGVGEVVFSGTATVDDRRRIRVSGSGHGLTMAPGVTIRSDTAGGQVRHDNSNGPVILQGTVISNVASRVIALFGFPLTIEGSLQVSNDGRIQANFGGVGSTIAASATLSVNTGELELFGDFTNEGAITITDGTLDIGQVAGDEWGNSGTITLNNATVELGGSFIADNVGNLSGSGTVTINGALDNTGQTLDLGSLFPGAVQLGTGGSIVGGTVEGTSLTLPESMSFTLDGITLAADLELERATTLTVINGLTLDNSTITLGGDNNFADLVFSGPNGEVSTLGGVGEVVFSGTATVDDRRRIRVSGSGHGLTVAPGVTIRSDTAGGQVRHDNSNGPVILQGTVISNVASRVIALFGFPLTIEGSLQVSNDGRIQANFGGVGSTIAASATLSVNTGELELFGDFTNEGAITITDGTLDIGQVAGDEWGNSGTITLNNATVELGGSFIADNVGNLSGSGTVTINGALDNTGQTLDLGSLFPGAVQLGTGGSIVGGTVEGTSLTLPESMSFTLDGITLAADLELERATTLTVINGLTLDNSTITLGGDNNFADLVFSGPNGEVSTLGGVGEVVFSGTATVDDRRRIRVSGSGHGLTMAPGVTIRSDTAGGQVRHDNSNGPVILQGTVISNVASRVITLFGFPLTIEGNLSVGAGSTMNLNNYTLAASAELDVAVGGLTSADFGRYTGSAAELAGTLDITLVNGFSPSLSDTIEIMTFTSRSGIFDAENGTDIGGGLSFQVNYDATDVTLEVIN